MLIDPNDFNEDLMFTAVLADLNIAGCVREVGERVYLDMVKRLVALPASKRKVLMLLFIKRINKQREDNNVYRFPYMELLTFLTKLEEEKYICVNCERIFKKKIIRCKKCGCYNLIYEES